MYASVSGGIYSDMIRKLKSGEYRLYSRKKDASTGKRRNLGTFSSLEKAKQHYASLESRLASLLEEHKSARQGLEKGAKHR